MEIRAQVPLAEYTSWLVGGPADWFCLPTSEAELEAALRFAFEKKIPWSVLGGGTNVLVSDQGVEGLVIGLRRFSGLQAREEQGRLRLEALAGTGKSELLKVFLKAKLAPALFLAGLPGDVGGGVVMNAGVGEDLKPREFGEIVDWVEVLRPDQGMARQRLQAQEITWTYRHSQGWQPGIITKVGISWPLQPEPDILQRVKEANRSRLSKQPLELPSCGSVFVNPPGHKAARLIESCRLKGYQIGGAQVSPKHANFIVNTGEATARQIWDLIAHVKMTVKKETGVELKTEVVPFGRGL